ncbi:MAG: Guanylate kinase [Parcubacteria group bacterium]|nr:Guanylate kinase [Parcubacteria group bacterium]
MASHGYIMLGPAGSGKNTLIKLVNEHIEFGTTVSCTTRPLGPGEVEGVAYHTRTREQFMEDVRKNLFAEWAEVHGNLYGTLEANLAELLAKGDVLFDVDIQGALQLKEKHPEFHAIFVTASTPEEIRRRLIARNRDSAEAIERRMKTAKSEIKQLHLADYLIVNPDGGRDHAVKELLCLLLTLKNGTTPSAMRFFNPTLASQIQAAFR